MVLKLISVCLKVKLILLIKNRLFCQYGCIRGNDFLCLARLLESVCLEQHEHVNLPFSCEFYDTSTR